MKNKKTKLLIIFSIAIAIFSIGIVIKTFQNDTFFNISIGKYILENGIDMKEHFCYVDNNLNYGYSHWAFDVVIYIIYNLFNFRGIYIATILFTILIGITLFCLLSKRNDSPVISFFITLYTLFVIHDSFTARSQIVSFLSFIIEIYCLEKFIETNNKKYAIMIILQSIIVANFHAATWPLILVLFMPYIASGLLNIFTFKNLHKLNLKKIEKNLSKLEDNDRNKGKISLYKSKIEHYKVLIDEPANPYATYKVVRKSNYNLRNLIILFIIVLFTGLLTPIKDTPYTYVIKSMFGESNFESNSSMDYVAEMQPITPIGSLPMLTFIIILSTFLIFTPSKLKTEHGFLCLGLLFMTLCSQRYVYLLLLLGSYILNDLVVQVTTLLIPEDIESLEKLFIKKSVVACLIFLVVLNAMNNLLLIMKTDYVDEELYPVGAVDYILKNLDYKNIRIYNSYNNGSYFMLNDIPVFIDSRLDVYCSEFNDTDIFYDSMQIFNDKEYYEDVFSKYNFTHILLSESDYIKKYVDRDSNYTVLYEDEYYTLYERHVENVAVDE